MRLFGRDRSWIARQSQSRLAVPGLPEGALVLNPSPNIGWIPMSAVPANHFLKASSGRALIIDGKAVAEGVTAEVTTGAADLIARGVTPGLAVVIVGEDPASQVYVRNKSRTATACGFHSVQHTLPDTTSEVELLDLVHRLNADPAIHGILVQLPLPAQINATKVLETILPAKDVDGFHPVNNFRIYFRESPKPLEPLAGRGVLVGLEYRANACVISGAVSSRSPTPTKEHQNG